MSKKLPFRPQASSSRAVSGSTTPSAGFSGGFGQPSAFGSSTSPLNHASEPPDLSGISDANLVVLLKNVLKRDSTTKAKALEDLQVYFLDKAGHGDGIEEALLEAWVKIYPRTSIDSSRRVRQLSHAVQGEMSIASGKRIAKFMPDIVGPWLSGINDPDKVVASSAQSSLKRVFPTPEKLTSIGKIYQRSLLQYSRGAILEESVNTLSDERTVSPDDAEAKYARVVASNLLVIASLLTELPADELRKQQEVYQDVLGTPKLWNFASHSDAAVRRSLYRLLRACILKEPEIVSTFLEVISTALVSKALAADQMGSSYDFIETLATLTASYPTVWTYHYTAKKSAISRLRQFLKKGSQGAHAGFWTKLSELFVLIPQTLLPKDLGEATDLVLALHGGIVSKDEPRANALAAWTAYLGLSKLVASQLQNIDQRTFLSAMIYPLVRQYIKPFEESTQWTIAGPEALSVVSQAVGVGVMPQILQHELPRLGQTIIQDIKTSSPEQSKDFNKSQTAVSATGHKWFSVQAEVLRSEVRDELRSTTRKISCNIVQAALEVLTLRNGKPYGAAGVVEASLDLCPDLLFEDPQTSNIITSFITETLPRLLQSPSQLQLVAILYGSHSLPEFSLAWHRAVDACLGHSDTASKLVTLEALLFSAKMPSRSDLALTHQNLQSFLLETFRSAIQGNSDWVFWGKALRYASRTMTQETVDNVLTEMTNALAVEDLALNVLVGFEQGAKQNGSLIAAFLTHHPGVQLLPRLLLLTESEDDSIAEKAATVTAAIESLLTTSADGDIGSRSRLEVIQSGFVEASSESLSIDTLVNLAEKSFKARSDGHESAAMQLLPSSEQWKTALNPFLNRPPNTSLAITDPMAGSIYLVDGSSEASIPEMGNSCPRDVNGYSAALRMAMYSTRAVKVPGLFNVLEVEKKAELCQYLLLATQLANDNLGVAEANDLWSIYTPETEKEVIDWLSESQALIGDWLHKSRDWFTENSPSEYSFVRSTIFERLTARMSGTSPSAFYSARAFCTTISELIDLHGSHIDEDLERDLRSLRRSADPLHVTAFLVAYTVPLTMKKVTVRMCNELVAELTTFKVHDNPDTALRQLVYLNAIIDNQEDVVETIAKQRLIFFIKHVVVWLGSEETSAPIQAEVCRAFVVLLPSIKDMYGNHWVQIIQLTIRLWERYQQERKAAAKEPRYFDQRLPLIHASLRLFARLRSLKDDEDANDDLKDAWDENFPQASRDLIALLRRSGDVSDEYHQPLKVVNELLARQISKMSLVKAEAPDEIYALLYAKSHAVQLTAFEILRKHIAATQEKIAFDAALEKTDARLPDELLSLILEAPTMAGLGDANFERSIPLPLRGYLLSWLLVFTHFQNTSYKVKTDYVTNLKDGSYVDGLLDFMFDFLGHGSGKPVDVSRFDVSSYQPETKESPEKDTQWLLTHIYFLCLKHIPSLTKTWWIHCKSRQKVLAVESWTEKFISPLIISDALASVSEWASTQDTSPEEALTVKVNPKAREVSASYEVDEQTMVIVIRLPGTYPLGQAVVEGVNRVAVDEKKWRSWLMNTQGVITFSNGNLADGLLTFRRNVTGALKGQTECAICYSIISSDKQLPSKKCGTCKNLFHSSCLFRWFKSSNSSSCPLCRNAFNYG